MNQEEFNSHNKNELYRIYEDLFVKVKKKTHLSKSLLFRQVTSCFKKSSQMLIQRIQVKSRTNINQYNPSIIQEVRVRRFEAKGPHKNIKSCYWKQSGEKFGGG